MFYSASTNGFYSRDIHGDAIPSDAVEITAEQHAALMAGQASGKKITADATGAPVLSDPAPARGDPEKKIEALWASADRYVNGYISGVAIGILTIGVIQGKPKAMAVTGWSNAIWTEYYTRKAAVTVDSVDNLDFSSFGPMPHSVPDLQAEIGL